MTRRAFIKQSGGLALAGSAALLSNSALAQSDTVRWRCASSFPKSLDTLYGTAELIARRVGQITGGKYQISVHLLAKSYPPYRFSMQSKKGRLSVITLPPTITLVKILPGPLVPAFHLDSIVVNLMPGGSKVMAKRSLMIFLGNLGSLIFWRATLVPKWQVGLRKK